MFIKIKRIFIILILAVMLFGYSCSRKKEEQTNPDALYTVTYNLMGGSYLDEGTYQITVKNGNKIENIEPIKDGFALVGWTTRLSDTLTADFDFNTSINSNTVLYAVWRRPQITFELNGGYFGAYNDIFELKDAFLNDFSSYMGWEIDEYGFFDYSYGRGIEFFKKNNYGEKWTPLLEYLKSVSLNPSYLQDYIDSNRDHNSTTSPFVRAEIAGFLKLRQDERTSWPYIKTAAYNDHTVLEGIWKYFKGDSINFYSGSSDYELPIPHKDGYHFLGWYDNADFTGTPITYIEKGSFENKTYFAKWKQNIKINYVSNVEVTYNSKQDLFNAFFTEYYNFLINNNKQELLTNSGINTLEDFLNVALDYNYDNGQMRGLANIISSTYLDIEVGGQIQDQSTDTFIGYCYHNNKFREFIDFIMKFFSWWREDEGYTTPTNNGSDFFASAWASLVDTQKFFYYDHTTSYVKTKRVIDCFKYIPGVTPYFHLTRYYMGEDLSNYNVMYVGYQFEGFYIDKDYQTDANTYLNSCNEQEVTVYIKFTKK